MVLRASSRLSRLGMVLCMKLASLYIRHTYYYISGPLAHVLYRVPSTDSNVIS